MKRQRFIIGGVSILLFCCGMLPVPSQNGTTASASPDGDAVAAPRMYADLSLSFSQEALIDEKKLERAITAALVKQGITISQVAITRGNSITIAFKSSEDLSCPVPHVRLAIDATNNSHLPVGVYNYGIDLSEIREVDTVALKPIYCQILGTSSNYSLHNDIIKRIPSLLAQYYIALSGQSHNQEINEEENIDSGARKSKQSFITYSKLSKNSEIDSIIFRQLTSEN
jgi:hypothetical protein